MPADAASPHVTTADPALAPEVTTDQHPVEAVPARYDTRQLVVHWAIVMLVAMQFLMNEGMVRSFMESTEVGAFVLTGGAITHATGGTFILLVMLYRVWLRSRYGAPPPPSSLPHWLQRVSRANHYAFYALLIAMPLVGWLAIVTLWGWVGLLHVVSGWLLLALIVAHAAGAFWHAFKRDGTIARILQPDPAHEVQASVTPEA